MKRTKKIQMGVLYALPLLLGSLAYAGTWRSIVLAETPGAPLCESLATRLNAFPEECVSDAIETYPEFSEPPWRALDPRDYVDLIGKLIRYKSGRDLYFSAPQNMNLVRGAGQHFVEHGGELRIWRTRLMSMEGGATNAITDTAPQTVVLLVDKIGAAAPPACSGTTTKNWIRSTFIVLPDLSGPDPSVGQGLAYALSTRWPVLYRGQTLLINGTGASTDHGKVIGGEFHVFISHSEQASLVGYCTVKFFPSHKATGVKRTPPKGN